MPDEGEDITSHIDKKYGPGSAARFLSDTSPLYSAGEACGVNFNKDPKRKIFTTAKCHSLMGYTKGVHGNEKANELMSVMFTAYFVNARSVNQAAVLKELYAEIGLEWTEEAAACLDPMSEYSQEAEMGDQAVKMKSVSGVPFFIIERSDGSAPIVFSGAQPVEVIQDALEECSTSD